MNIPYVFYTHDSYDDVIEIQYEYIVNIDNKILITNNIKENVFDIFNVGFKNILYYDDSLPYSQRILNAIDEIDNDFIFLLHENDILIKKDDSILEKCIDLMLSNNYDRIDFQVGGPNFSGHIETIPIDNDKYFLSRNYNPNDYIYNVNPSIWRVSTLRNILNRFPNHSYRNIEDPEVQKYCIDSDFKIFKLMGKDMLKSTPFTLLDFFQYIHITHAGKFLPINNNLSENLKEHYYSIIEKHKLLEGNREFEKYHTWGW